MLVRTGFVNSASLLLPMDRLKYQRDVDALAPKAQRYEVYFENPTGLGVRVSPDGRKVYFLFYRTRAGRFRRYTLGPCKDWVLGTSRETDPRKSIKDEVKRLQAEIAVGRDPQEEKLAERAQERERRDLRRRGVPAGQGLKHFIELYLQDKAVASRKSVSEKRRILEKDLLGALGDRRITDIGKDDLELALARKGATRAGDLLHSHANTFFKWLTENPKPQPGARAIPKKFLAANPMAGIPKPLGAVKKRGRYLRPREIKTFWEACEKLPAPYGALFRFALVTAARRSECATVEWSEIDLEEAVWRLPARKAKNGREHLIPLGKKALQIMQAQPVVLVDREGIKTESPFVFARSDGGVVNAWSAAMQLLNKECGFQRVGAKGAKITDEEGEGAWISLHDLRRTAATELSYLRVAPHIRERVLCHAQTALNEHYDKHDYLPEKREALEALSARIESILSPV